jgi:ubiquinone biosynthesis protein
MGVLTGIRRNFKSISRYNQILKVLLKYGFEDLVKYLDERKQFIFFQKRTLINKMG